MATISEALRSLNQGLETERQSRRDEMQFSLGLMQFQAERSWRKEESDRQIFASNITMAKEQMNEGKITAASRLVSDMEQIGLMDDGEVLIIGTEDTDGNVKDWSNKFKKNWKSLGGSDEEAQEMVSLIYGIKLNPADKAAIDNVLAHGRIMFQRYTAVRSEDTYHADTEAYAKAGLFGRNFTSGGVRGTDQNMQAEHERYFHNLMVAEDMEYQINKEINEFRTTGDTDIQSEMGMYAAPRDEYKIDATAGLDEVGLAGLVQDMKHEKKVKSKYAGLIAADSPELKKLQKDAIAFKAKREDIAARKEALQSASTSLAKFGAPHLWGYMGQEAYLEYFSPKGEKFGGRRYTSGYPIDLAPGKHTYLPTEKEIKQLSSDIQKWRAQWIARGDAKSLGIAENMSSAFYNYMDALEGYEGYQKEFKESQDKLEASKLAYHK